MTIGRTSCSSSRSPTSLDYDLCRKPLVYAAFGVRELWVIDAARRVVHRHDDVTPSGYARISRQSSDTRPVPRHAPSAFGFALDMLVAL